MDTIQQKHQHAPRVLIFVESDNGFGHFNVVKEITKKIHNAGGEVGLASGTFFHSGEAFDFGKIPHYHLPSVIFDQKKGFYFDQTDDTNTHPSTRKNYLTQPQRQELRKAQIRKACEDFKPDVVVFEMYPFLMRFRDPDLEAVKEVYADKAKRPHLVCLCRDIVHSAKPTETVDILNKQFDQILVRGDGKLNKLQDCVPEYQDITTPITYAGNIVAKKPRSHDIPEEEKQVFVFSGGGYKKTDPAFFESAIRAKKHSKELAGKTWTVIISNNCPQDEFERYQALAKDEAPDGSLHVIRPMPNEQFSQLLNNSAGAIVRSSYNTTFELVRSKVPFVVIPRAMMGYDQEQQFRADALAGSGLAKAFQDEDLKLENAPESLARTLDEAVISRSTSPLKLDFKGAARIGQFLTTMGNKASQIPEQPSADVTAASAALALESASEKSRS